ncbi:MAG: apolipoprotein N-acyltransferase [Byssovorax sp.]
MVFALTAPPTDLYPAVLVGLALLAASIGLDAPSAKRAFGRGAAWGTAAGLVGLRFVPAVIQRFTPLGSAASYLALLLLAAAQSLLWAAAAATTVLLQRRARMPFPLAFAAGVLLAVSLPAIFVWTPAGLISPWPSFVQLADLIGERGVSALLAFTAALLAQAALALAGRSPQGVPLPPPAEPARLLRHAVLRHPALRPALVAIAILVALPIHGKLRIQSIEQASAALPAMRVGLVDHVVPPLERWDPKNHAPILASLRALSRASEDQGAELTIWPEAAYPYSVDHEARRAPTGAFSIVGRMVRGPILAGLITRDKPIMIAPGRVEQNSFNSAMLVMPDGSMSAPADKLELLWFGEMVPGGTYLPWLRRLFQKSGGLIPGAEPRALTLPRAEGPALRMGVLNCYEDTLAGVGRALSSALAPNLLVNITNDAWFYDTAESELHARLGAMRAIELRLDVVRAVNLGVTSWVDAAGVVRARYAEKKPDVLMATPAVREGSRTIYARAGDVPAWLFLIAAIGLYARKRVPPAPDGDGPGATARRSPEGDLSSADP